MFWHRSHFSSSLQSDRIPDALCYKDGDCMAGEAVVAGNGKGRVPPVLSGRVMFLQRHQPSYNARDL